VSYHTALLHNHPFYYLLSFSPSFTSSSLPSRSDYLGAKRGIELTGLTRKKLFGILPHMAIMEVRLGSVEIQDPLRAVVDFILFYFIFSLLFIPKCDVS
jgi:hypothetical protein